MFMVKNQKIIHSSDESNEEKMSQKTPLVDRLESVFRLDTPQIKTKQVDGLEFITIVYEEKISKGFGMISIGGHRLQRIMPMIENGYRLNSISTSYHKGTMYTTILIVEGSA